MNLRALLTLLATAFILAACACLEPAKGGGAVGLRAGAPSTDRNCWNGNGTPSGVGPVVCVVLIDVQDGTDCTQANNVTVDAPALGVLQNSRELDIIWIVRTEGYRFAANGVTIEKDPLKEFDTGRRGPRFYVLRDHNNAGGDPFRSYKYDVQLVKADGTGTKCWLLDPVIINDI
jgi:hypothetical protein